jgi:hypothetical protein
MPRLAPPLGAHVYYIISLFVYISIGKNMFSIENDVSSIHCLNFFPRQSIYNWLK